MSRIAVVAGATGLVGAALLRRLAAHGAWHEVRALGRRSPDFTHARLRSVATDFTGLDSLGAALAADDVFCCLGTTLRKAGSRAQFERVDLGMVVELARAAQRAGARQFLVVSAVGASPRAPAFYSRVKGRMEDAVAALPFTAVHIVQPSLLLGARTETRPGEALAQRLAPLLAPALAGPLARYRPVSADEVAAALVTLALAGAAGVHRHTLPLR